MHIDAQQITPLLRRKTIDVTHPGMFKSRRPTIFAQERQNRDKQKWSMIIERYTVLFKFNMNKYTKILYMTKFFFHISHAVTPF